MYTRWMDPQERGEEIGFSCSLVTHEDGWRRVTNTVISRWTCVILFFVDVCGYIGHHIKELKANGRIKEGVER